MLGAAGAAALAASGALQRSALADDWSLTSGGRAMGAGMARAAGAAASAEVEVRQRLAAAMGARAAAGTDQGVSIARGAAASA
ncbi:MAG TPA: hypothetical protein VFU81_17485, partial [Thermomicrobiales bacterium]|nr:hypothetical protein [Thermomicrobiales bacterium]